MIVFAVDSNLVRPGWTPLVVLLLLGIVLFLLGRSMLKQFGKIDVPADHEPPPTAGDGVPGAGETAEERTVKTSGDQPPIPDLRAGRDGSGDASPKRP
jgi:hypothetical protein